MIQVGNNRGVWYFANPDGTFPVDVEIRNALQIPVAIENMAINIPTIQDVLALVDPTTGTNAYGSLTITAAASGSYSAVDIDGVAQISSSVTISTTVPFDAATAIATAVNAHTPATGPNYTANAVFIDSTSARVDLIHPSQTNANDGDTISFTATTGNTATASDIKGGRAAGDYRLRVFYDTGVNNWSTSTMPSTAEDVTDAMAFRGYQHVAAETTATVNQNQIDISRKGNQFTVLVTGSSSNPDLNSISYPNARVGDTITLKPAGAGDPFLLKNTTDIKIGRDIQLTDVQDAVVLRVSQQNPLQVELVSVNDRDFVQASDEIERVSINASGTYNIIPNSTGTPPANTTYRNNVTVTATQTLTANYNFLIDTSNMRNGEKGIIDGNGKAITVGSNTLSVQSGTVIRNIDEGLAATGQWKAFYSYDGTEIQIEIVPDFSTQNTGFIRPQQLKNNSNRREVIVPVSFEAGEQAQYPVIFASDCNIISAQGTVIKQIAATDNAVVDIQVSSTSVATITHIANENLNSTVSASPVSSFPVAVSGGNTIFFETSKTTPGGKTLVSVVIEMV